MFSSACSAPPSSFSVISPWKLGSTTVTPHDFNSARSAASQVADELMPAMNDFSVPTWICAISMVTPSCLARSFLTWLA